MRRVSAFEGAAAGLEFVAAPETVAVERGEEFGRAVAVEVGQAEGVGCYVPAEENGVSEVREKRGSS